MDTDIKDVLVKRFTKAIKRSLPKCPLIGPKWFKLYPNGKPADFQFTGCRKLAKAACKKPEYMLKMMLKNLSVKDIAEKVTPTRDFRINVTLKDEFKGGQDR